MKVLLDENLDHALRHLLGQHEVVTVAYRVGLHSRTASCFVLPMRTELTFFSQVHGTLSYEQNLTGRRLAVVALSAIQLPIIKKHLPKIIAAIDSTVPGSFQAVDCGAFSRKKLPGQRTA